MIIALGQLRICLLLAYKARMLSRPAVAHSSAFSEAKCDSFSTLHVFFFMEQTNTWKR